MIARYNRASLWVGGIGVALQLGLPFVAAAIGPTLLEYRGLAIAFLPAMMLGTVMVFIGLALYAKAKGRSVVWCAAGFLGILGFLLLAGLKDYTKFRVDDPRGFVPESEWVTRHPQDAVKPGNRAARASVYLGVISIVPLLGLMFGVAGIVCGVLGLRKAPESGGRGAAWVGLLMSVAILGMWGVIIGGEVLDDWKRDRQLLRARERAAARAQMTSQQSN
jgi:hypothetical protein